MSFKNLLHNQLKIINHAEQKQLNFFNYYWYIWFLLKLIIVVKKEKGKQNFKQMYECWMHILNGPVLVKKLENNAQQCFFMMYYQSIKRVP